MDACTAVIAVLAVARLPAGPSATVLLRHDCMHIGMMDTMVRLHTPWQCTGHAAHRCMLGTTLPGRIMGKEVDD
jgi:hypothetical protein